MATKPVVTKVWIEDGCIVCDACETAAPDVFEVLEDTCIVRPAALVPDFTKPRSEAISDAAEECPGDVIKFETVSEEVAGDSVPDASPEPAAEADTPPAKPVVTQAKKPAVEVAPAEPVGPTADPSIKALLETAKQRGGHAGILKKTASEPDEVQAWRRKKVKDLPPDGRQAKVIEAAQKAKKNPTGSRRDFISDAALGVGWASFGVGLGVSVGPAFARFMMPNVLEEPDPRVRVGKVQKYTEMSPGDVNEDYKPQGIWLIRLEDRVAALNIVCTHLGCIPNWLPNDRKFKCPCHGSGYRPNGINFEGPTPRPLERFRMIVDKGILIVDKSKKYQYELGQWDMPGSYIEA